ncbi:MAG TPA: MFS transporter [Ilumatobacteraceae bacterium]|nr:MFS transporter [Ilumatobacteraceae bacterium]HRB04334.1 MFS transporter [Ilumatobacteraceae bacterium]
MSGRSSTFTALRIRNYRLFAIGSLVSNIGTWMQRVAQDWLVLQLTGSGKALGITTGLQFLPMLLFSPMAGVFADRFSKRRVIAVAQVVLGVTAGLLGLLAVAGWVAAWHVYVIAFVFGTAAAFDTPARQAFVNEMVPRATLSNAVALNSASFNLARMIGPALAGGLIALLGSGAAATGWVILVNAATYIAVLVSLQRMRASDLTPIDRLARGKGQIRDGLRYVRGRPDIMLIMAIVFSAGTFGLNFQMTTALMATEVFDKGAGEYGLLGSILAIGSLAGSLLSARRPLSRQRLVIGASLAFGATETVAGLMPNYATFALVLPLCGITALTLITTANALVQMSTDAAVRGRVMALYLAIFMGGTPVGAPMLGWIAERYGARWTMVGGGLLTMLGTLIATAVFARSQNLMIWRVPQAIEPVGPVGDLR